MVTGCAALSGAACQAGFHQSVQPPLEGLAVERSRWADLIDRDTIRARGEDRDDGG